jgi:pimeloyl-ACP methyl ester carboxylesterase
MVKDIQAASAWLKKQGAKQVSVVGAGLGANLGLELAAADPALKTVVLLSPGLNIRGYKPSKSIVSYGPRPILFAAGDQDTLSASTVKYLDKQVSGTRKVLLLPGTDRGAKLMEENPNLEDAVLNWLAGNYESAGGLEGPGAVQTGQVDSGSSQGVRFGEK